MKRREFLQNTAALAAMASLPASFARAAAHDTRIPTWDAPRTTLSSRSSNRD